MGVTKTRSLSKGSSVRNDHIGYRLAVAGCIIVYGLYNPIIQPTAGFVQTLLKITARIPPGLLKILG